MIDYSDLDEDDFIFLIDEFFITLFKPLIFKSDFLEDNEGVVRIIRNNDNFQRMFERFNPKKIESAIVSAFQIHTTIIKNSSLQKNKVNFIQEIEELDLLLKGNLIFDRKIIKGNFSKLFFNIYDNYRKSLNLTKLFIHLQHLHNKILNEKKKI